MEISIGKLSEAFGLSDEALRFYEKKGLLHPERKASGYRVFQRSDIQLVANIRRLQNQNFSLEETRSVYSGTDEETLSAMYDDKIGEFRRSIAYQEHVLAHMEDARRTLCSLPESLNVPCLCDGEPVYLLEYPSIPDMWDRIPQEPLLKELLHHLPIVSFTSVIDKSAFEGSPAVPRKGICFFERDLAVLNVDPAPMRRIDAKKAVTCLFRLEDGHFDTDRIIKTMRAFMDENHLRAADAAFTVFSASLVNRQGSAVHYARLCVPVT